ncbi:MAG: hypothetical protein BGO48_16280 [Mucilaginibacter sp. 44-25]|nr:MAG: hypothetical protein BGO48_16280 [Mucilaginibacter sp. 44-25]
MAVSFMTNKTLESLDHAKGIALELKFISLCVWVKHKVQFVDCNGVGTQACLPGSGSKHFPVFLYPNLTG